MEQQLNNQEKKVDRSAGRSTGIPKGVYRFETHEEANEWMDKMLARNAPPKTDQPSTERGEQPPKV